jgi:hypothetical protein
MLPAVNARRSVFLNLMLYFEMPNATRLPKKRIKKTLGIKIMRVLMKYFTTAILRRASA